MFWVGVRVGTFLGAIAVLFILALCMMIGDKKAIARRYHDTGA